MEVVRCLDGFVLEKRSATLDGSIPLRAAQGCKPLQDGNAAGYHLRLVEPAVLHRGRPSGTIQFTDELLARFTQEYAATIDAVVERGLLVRDGYWHRQLRQDFVWREDDTLFLWTGLLVRPAAGVWVLVSGSFNRRCLVELHDHVLPDEETFTPLVLPLNLASLRADVTWLDTELACLLPLKPDVQFSITSLREDPRPGAALNAFYDPEYRKAKAEGQITGRYRRHTAGEAVVEADGTAECRLVVAGGPNLHQVDTFACFATAGGFTREYPGRDRLQFAVLHSICDVTGRWDGTSLRDLVAEMPEETERLRRDWAELYGAEAPRRMEWWTHYCPAKTDPQRNEPQVSLVSWVLGTTPPGWSSLVDSYHQPGLDGMRGVVSSDSYFLLPTMWQIHNVGDFHIGRGTALGRALPVPRRLLGATYREVSLDEAVAASGAA
jgi:hypothetical protein